MLFIVIGVFIVETQDFTFLLILKIFLRVFVEGEKLPKKKFLQSNTITALREYS
jgi:hypothetical protein